MTVRVGRRRVVAGLALAASLAGSCSDDGGGSSPEPTAGPSGPPPVERAVTITTTACGHASGTTGSGVIVGDANVLTAAHVVVGATDVVVDGHEGVVFALDRTRDLAVLKVPGVGAGATSIELTELAGGDEVRVVGGATSGTVAATVGRRVVMDVDDVRATTRSQRAGYELDAAIAGGDSGAGVYAADGRLAGIVFAVPTERDGAAYAVGAAEIEAVLSSTAVGEHRCDPARSRLVGPGS